MLETPFFYFVEKKTYLPYRPCMQLYGIEFRIPSQVCLSLYEVFLGDTNDDFVLTSAVKS
jgi:hypothetical protein